MSSRFLKPFKATLAILALVFIVFAGTVVLAQTTLNTGINYGAQTGLAGTDIRTIIANIIRIFLGLLGIIALALVIYGGFLYMTAGGNAEQVETAKKYLKNAAIGLAIILSSFAIVQFVISKLQGATGGTGGDYCVTHPIDPVCLVTPPPCTGLGCGGGGGVFYSRMAPTGAQEIKNIVLSFSFYQGLGSPAAVDFSKINRTNLKIVKDADPASQPAGDFVQIAANLVEFHPTGSCVDTANPVNSDPSNTCFEKNTKYKVELTTAILASNGRPLDCSTSHPCLFDFTTGDRMDREPPTVSVIQPDSGSVPTDSQVEVRAGFTDDAGVKLLAFYQNSLVINNIVISPALRSGSSSVIWNTAGILGVNDLKARAYDLDNHNTLSSPVRVRVLPVHCFNGITDFSLGETGPVPADCGPRCDVCDGGGCTSNFDCASGFCLNGICVSRPKITNVDAKNGAIGNYITIYGRGFGNYSIASSLVRFLGLEDITTDDKPATVVSCFGQPSWHDNAIVVKVPDGAVSGPIQVSVNGTAGWSDQMKNDKTNDNYGPVFPTSMVFIVNQIVRPGLCGLNPATAKPLEIINAQGTRLGSTASTKLLFGNAEAALTAVSDDSITSSVPNLSSQLVDVRANVGGVESNSIPFVVASPAQSTLPRIDALDPQNGPVGNFVTITGVNFGSTMPEVWFQRGTDKKQAFKPDCAVMTASQLIVKVPDGLGEGMATVTVVTTAGNSNSVIFTIDTTPLRPGLCSLEPDNGPISTLITLTGEKFGNSGNVIYGTLATSTLDALSWIDTKATDRVPSLTVNSVPIKIWNKQLYSNALNYKIGDCSKPGNACLTGKVCCEGSCRPGTSCTSGPKASVYSWYFSTGSLPVVPKVVEDCDALNGTIIPTPSPAMLWDKGDDVCVNAVIKTRFTTLIKTSSVNISSFLVETCSDRSCTSGLQTVPGILSFNLVIVSLATGYLGTTPPAVYDTVTFTPLNAFSVSTWYRVSVGTGVSSFVFGSNGLENTNAEANLAVPYIFQFKTGTENCTLNKVLVSPDNFVFNAFNTLYYPNAVETMYSASALAESNRCLSINSSSYNWIWNTGDRLGTITDDYASITNDIDSVTGRGKPEQDLLTKDRETGAFGQPNVGKAWVRTNVNLQPFSDSAEFRITLPEPKIITKWPECNSACVNAEIAAVSSVSLLPSSIDNDSVQLCEVSGSAFSSICEHVDGISFTLTRTNIDNDTIVINHANLKPGQYYRILLRAWRDGADNRFVVKSAAGNYLQAEVSEGNKAFVSWYFRTKTDDRSCSIDRVQVSPETSVVQWVGAVAPVESIAYGSKDECAPFGQRLNARDYNWLWSVDPGTVASVSSFDRGTVVSGNGCNDSCVYMGQQTELLPAYCGNGRLDAGEDCDVAITGFQDLTKCDLNCKSVPDKAGTDVCINATGQDCCGNGETENNEDCDLGVSRNGQPQSICSNRCLFVGTKISRPKCLELFPNNPDRLQCASTALSLCGDEVIDASVGEECDVGVNNGRSGSGCAANCLTTAKIISTWGSPGCGDRLLTGGNNEECDGERWCTTDCQNIGSSYGYGSYCGNGVTEHGEDVGCETPASGGDTRIDPWQLVKALGNGLVNAQKQQVANITAASSDKQDVGNFVLQCGYDFPNGICPLLIPGEGKCSLDEPCAPGRDSCCYLRPKADVIQPSVDSNVCPNTAIKVQFREIMDQATFSSSTNSGFFNLVLAKNSTDGACAEPGTMLMAGALPSNASLSWWQRAWRAVSNWFGARPAEATYCQYGQQFYTLSFENNTISPGGVEKTGTLVTLNLLKPLQIGAIYRLSIGFGISSSAGVKVVPFANKTFSTRSDGICKIENVSVGPVSWWFNKKDAEKNFTVHAFGPGKQELTSTPGYSWEYSWSVDDGQILDIQSTSPVSFDQSSKKIVAKQKNGLATITAHAEIITDTSQQPTIGKIFDGKSNVQVFLCENPWPNDTFNDVYGLGLVDAERNNNSVIPSMAVSGMSSNWTNLKLLYCRDAGKPNDRSDDLPNLNLPAVISPNPVMPADVGLIKEFFFTFVDPPDGEDVKRDRDSVGLRVYKNANLLSLPDWYKKQNLTGTPAPLKIGSYDALQVGRTYYIDALNVNISATSKEVFSNVYVFTFSNEPISETVEIINQLLANLVFNVNVPNPRVCSDVGSAIACTKDLDCSGAETCDAPLDKLYRDYTRLKDWQLITNKLWAYKQANGEYPKLDENPTLGTYLPAYTNDKWRSWQGVLGNALGYTLPTDPLDNFYGCGSSTLNVGNPPPGENLGKYDANTCWNSTDSRFICPNKSHVYQYQVDGGQKVKLKADFESGTAYTWMSNLTIPPDVTIRYQNDGCSAIVQGISETCWDGVVGAREICEKGVTVQACTTSDFRPGFKTKICNNSCNGYEGLPSELIGYWAGENSTEDYAGINNGVAVNGVTYAAGKIGKAFNFDGINNASKPGGSYVKIPNSLQPGSFTISAWIKLSSLPSNKWTILRKSNVSKHDWDNPSGNFDGFKLFVNNFGMAILYYGRDGTNYVVNSNPGQITLNSWHQVVGTIDNNDGKIKFFVDGTMTSQMQVDLPIVWRSSVPLIIGADNRFTSQNSDGNRNFQGMIDEVRFYNRALTASEVTSLYNSSSVATSACVSATSCGNGIKDGPEECDDGADNGKYGKCGTDCKRPNNSTVSPVSAGFCGNGKQDVTAGIVLEVCDSSSLSLSWCSESNRKLCSTGGASSACPSGDGICVNSGGKYNYQKDNSCSWDCQSYDYCGDGKVNAKYEQCEKSEACQVGTCSNHAAKYCELDADCTGGTCTAKQSGKRYCKAPNAPQPVWDTAFGAYKDGAAIYQTPTCQWDKILTGANVALTCLPTSPPSATPGVCGDGTKNENEICDAGAATGRSCAVQSPLTSCTFCAYGCQEVITVR